MKKKVLYIEDEPFLGKIVHETLQKQGFDVVLITDGARVMQSFNTFTPDICVLDIMLPNIDGYTLCADIRKKYPNLPVIFLTAKTETLDLVKGFEVGGTDYIRKPFSMEELIVRINNLLNLMAGAKNPKDTQSERVLGKYRYSPMRYELISPTRTVKLSQREQEVLSILTTNINQTVERKYLLKTVWGDDSFFNSRTLDVYIRKLREYFLEDSNIELVTLKGKGYLFLIR
ncbi:MAG: response regulator transcription factor [Bacteroidales bacterium]|nr:response regulator transcription factor [Bacteroidales bacterium]